MKLALIFLLISSTIFAQCDDVKSETDEFTGAVIIETKWERIAPGLDILIIQHNKVIIVMLSADLDCVSPSSSQAFIKFDDGQVVTLPHIADIDCGDTVALSIKLNDQIEAFTTKTIAKIRLSGERTLDFSLTKPKYIGDTLNKCFNLSQL